MELLPLFITVLVVSIVVFIAAWIGFMFFGEFVSKFVFIFLMWLTGVTGNISFWGLVLIGAIKVLKKEFGLW